MSTAPTAFSFPTQIRYGAGTLSELPDRLAKLGVTRPLVVTDPGLPPTPAFALLRRALGAAGEGKTWKVFTGVRPNPEEADVVAGAKAFRDGGCDGVVAFGGGSALDAGKAVRLFVKRPDLKLKDYDWAADWSGLAPCVCVPTTAGTGSEVGRSSVIVPEGRKAKGVFFQPNLLAALVILDPEVTRGLPPALTAATGADALTHCIESYTCPVFHPMCDGIALEGIALVVKNLPRAFRDGDDLEARGAMLVAATMGAVAFQKDLGTAHSLAHALSAVCGMHHGAANALVLPEVMRWNAARKPGLYRRVGLACGLSVVDDTGADADRKTVAFITTFLKGLGLGDGLAARGVREEQLEAVVDVAFADPCHKTNVLPVTRDDLKALLKEALA
ncbi:MAG: iron-containing alcohol dehydrogenase [Candidatus Coatesbacteria bacterium]